MNRNTIHTIRRRATQHPPTWHQQAACRNHPDPDLWFPTTGQTTRTQHATTICATCPVQHACADHAHRNQEMFGIWGGQPQTERRTQLTAPPTAPRDLAPCGTYAAYVRHLRHGQTPCRPCTQANTRYNADKRSRAHTA